MVDVDVIMKMIPRIYAIWIIFGIAAITSKVHSVTEKQMYNAPPVPGLPENTDPTQPTSTIKAKPGEVLLSNSYLPAVMQAVAYYVELIQYEPQYMTTIEPPYTVAVVGQPVQSEEFTSTVSTTQRTTQRTTYSTTTRPTTRPTWYSTTTRPTTRPTWYSTTVAPLTTRYTTTTTAATTKPTTQSTWWSTTTARPTYQYTTKPTIPSTRQTTQRPWYADQTTHAHNPGYYQPSSPLYDYPDSAHRPTQKPQTGNLPLLSISQTQFFDWFLQMKTKGLSEMSEYDLQFLHQLPSGLLQDILYERYEQPAFLDKDNVDEFRKVYDDFYGRNQPVTGRKKVPPTKPYVQLLMLYDLLKREAKKLMLNKFQGYSPEMLEELHKTSQGSAERQLHTLLYRMITQDDVNKPDIVVRVTAIIEDLITPESTLAMALRYIPPLAFVP
ncbi:mucin-5AC [Bradysia coprophila]|uniref:mucin-5AC n=1 Tax=Bradysia coprophila TaxID=38358 RepID=UPI00187D7499|nr:mucin-5AC [Bradysia coprophila]